MTIRLMLSLLLGLALGMPEPGGTAESLRLHYPPENLVVSGGGILHVIGEPERDLPGAEMAVRLNGGPAESAMARLRQGGGTVFHAEVRLAPGLNSVEVELRSGGRPVARVQRKVFFLSPLNKDKEPPSRFSRQSFHRTGGEPACVGCHQLEPRPEDEGPASPEQSTCYPCHARLTKTKEVHGPAALWACTRCHNPSSAPVRYATPDPIMILCFSCHGEQKERFYGSPYQHGPTATGQCTICHNPHGTDNLYFLKKAAWDLCTTCHFEKASGRHVISWGPNGQGHPTRGKPDPTRVNRELSCASCHNPHAASAPKLWNFNAVRWLDLCRNCHKRILGG